MSLARILWVLAYALRHGDLTVLRALPVWVAQVVGFTLGLVLGGALMGVSVAR
jgi:hypothetical protein